MEQNQNQNFYRYIFNLIFLLTQHSLFFQIISWNFLSRFFIKIESAQCFSKTYSEIESTWSINSSKEEIVFSRDTVVKNYLCNVLCKFLIKMEAHGGVKSKNKHPNWLYCTVVELSEAATGGIYKNSCS